MINSGELVRRKRGSRALDTGKLISAHYLDIEYLLERVETATSHYQTLGVERSSTSDEIIEAYQKTVSILHPPYHKVRAAVPDEMLARVDEAFSKVSKAFSELTDAKKREQYDQSLKSGSRAPSPQRKKKPAATSEAKSKTSEKVEGQRPASDSVEIAVAREFRPVFTKSVTKDAPVDRRRCERFKLSVPIMIAGYDSEGKKWQEISKTLDVSRMGVGVRMRRSVKHGQVVHVTLPLPAKLRAHGFSDAGYNMYAIVRRFEPLTEAFRVVGLEFIGAQPPADYLRNPCATFRTQKWSGPDRRLESRKELSESVVVEYLDSSMQVMASEEAVTENVSASGARICVRSAPPEFEYVKLASPDRGFRSLAAVRNRYSTNDGNERVCLQFVDQQWPM